VRPAGPAADFFTHARFGFGGAEPGYLPGGASEALPRRAFTSPIRCGDIAVSLYTSDDRNPFRALGFHRQEAFEAEEWRLAEIRQGLEELDAGQTVSHERVSTWLRSWGKPGEGKAPR
jgi:predicted transcriptional regulator